MCASRLPQKGPALSLDAAHAGRNCPTAASQLQCWTGHQGEADLSPQAPNGYSGLYQERSSSCNAASASASVMLFGHVPRKEIAVSLAAHSGIAQLPLYSEHLKDGPALGSSPLEFISARGTLVYNNRAFAAAGIVLTAPASVRARGAVRSRDRFGTSAVHCSNMFPPPCLPGTSRLHGGGAAASVTSGQFDVHAKIAVQVGLRAVEIEIADRNAPQVSA
jgi:hypothetical protein